MASEELHLQRRGECLPYQIFPDSLEDFEVMQLKQENPGAQRGRLPSIVVDPTLVSEEQNTRLQWQLQRRGSAEEVDDSCQNQSDPQTNSEDPGEHGNTAGSREERAALIKSSSDTVLPGLVDYSRLTPPPSPTLPEVAPPCFRS